MTQFLDIEGMSIPVKIIEEYRSGARVSLGGKSVILRVPKVPFEGSQVHKHLTWAKNWLMELIASRPHVLNRYTSQCIYIEGTTWKIGGEIFTLDIKEEPRSSGWIKLGENKVLMIKIPDNSGYHRQKLIKSLLIKFSQKYFLTKISERVHYFNRQFIKMPINGIRLKYNTSNWGSCSTGNNLNFSVRLLFAPDDVIDYVVIHELAHLHEMNHSPRFWNIVKSIMPDYESKEEYLKKYGSQLDF